MSYVHDDEPKIAYLVQVLFLDQEDAESAAEHVILFEGEPKEYAMELVDELGGIQQFRNPEFYFDYDGFGRDLKMDGFDWLENEEDEQFFMDMSDQNLGYHFVDEVYGGLENMSSEITDSYIDYDALARDMVAGGDIDEFEYDGTDYVIANPHESFTYLTNPVMCEDDLGNQTYSPSDPKTKSERPYRGICGGKGISGGDNAGRRVALKDGKPVKITHKELQGKIARRGLDVLATQSYLPSMGSGSRRGYVKALKGHGYELRPTTYEYYDEKTGTRDPKTIDFIRKIEEEPVVPKKDTIGLENYVTDYYGVRGSDTYIPKFKKVVGKAIDIYVNYPDTKWDGGDGDSFDRELIRDIAYNLLGEDGVEYDAYAKAAIKHSKKRKNPADEHRVRELLSHINDQGYRSELYKETIRPLKERVDIAFIKGRLTPEKAMRLFKKIVDMAAKHYTYHKEPTLFSTLVHFKVVNGFGDFTLEDRKAAAKIMLTEFMNEQSPRSNPMVKKSAGGGATYMEYVLPSADSPDFAIYDTPPFKGDRTYDEPIFNYYPIEALEPYTAESLAETLTERFGFAVSAIDLGTDGRVHYYEVGMEPDLGTSEFSRMLQDAIPEGKFILYTDGDLQSGDPALFEDWYSRSDAHPQGMRHRPNPSDLYTLKSNYGLSSIRNNPIGLEHNGGYYRKVRSRYAIQPQGDYMYSEPLFKSAQQAKRAIDAINQAYYDGTKGRKFGYHVQGHYGYYTVQKYDHVEFQNTGGIQGDVLSDLTKKGAEQLAHYCQRANQSGLMSAFPLT